MGSEFIKSTDPGRDAYALRFYGPTALDPETGALMPRKTFLKLRADGSSEYSSEDDLKEAAALFWRNRSFGDADATITFGLDPKKDPGFRIKPDGTIEYLNDYAPTGSTLQALETITRLRPG